MNNGKTTSFSKIKHSNSSHNANLLLGPANTQSRHGSSNTLAMTAAAAAVGLPPQTSPLTSTPGNVNSMKTWRSDTHLHMYDEESHQQQVDVEEEEEDEIDRILQANGQLEFSDHAGLYDILNSQTNNNRDEDDDDEEQIDNVGGSDREYTLSKTNYRLTYGEKQTAANAANAATSRRDIFNLNPVNEDSLIFNTSFNGLLLQQSDYPRNDHDDYEEDEERPEETRRHNNNKKSYEEYYSNSSQYMDENSLMDWSMKLSQFEPNSPVKKRQHNAAMSNGGGGARQLDPTATTSWGKLKHSKSSSSNLGANSATKKENSMQHHHRQQHQTGRSNHQNNKQQPSSSSTSLVKCFQNSKVINSSSNNSSATSTSSSANENNTVAKEKTKTTCFSQLRQRSMSSIATNNHHTEPSNNTIKQQYVVSPNNNKMETSSSSSSTTNRRLVVAAAAAPSPQSTSSQYNNNNHQTIICMVVDKSQKSMLNPRDIQLLAAKLATALNQQQHKQQQRMIMSKKTSLPDLAFLNNYSDNNKSQVVSSSNQSTIPVSLSSPIANLVKQSSPISEEDGIGNDDEEEANKSPLVGSDLLKRKTLKSIKRYRQTKQNTEPCVVPYALSDNSIQMHHNQSQQNQRVFSQDTTNHHDSNSNNNSNRKPLKSCLKRKDTGTLVDTTQQHTSDNIKKCTRIIYQPIVVVSSLMFLPGVGHLFTCDLESTSRYCYYNNLERRRRMRAYKDLVRVRGLRLDLEEIEDDDDEEEEEDPTATCDKNEDDQHQYVLRTHNSENDLGVRNVLDFLITERIVNQQYNDNDDIKSSTLTTNTNSNSSSYSHGEEKKNGSTTAPPLQYNALIAMLKSAAKPKTANRQSPQQQQNNQSTQINKKITFLLNDQDLMTSVINKRAAATTSGTAAVAGVIDSDQISLGSLSESPPSEFKFSEDEEEDDEMSESFHMNNQTTTLTNKTVTNGHLKTMPPPLPPAPPMSAQKIAELKKIKKEFHRLLLKDSRLNSLKEILLELKQIQQKLTLVECSHTPPSSMHSLSSDDNNSSISLTNNQQSVYKELKEGVEKLSQCLFEFMKTSMKSIETTNNHQSSATTSSSTSSNMFMVKSSMGGNEPSPLLKQKNMSSADSATLSSTFSQYLQLWNLVEFTINLNIVQSEDVSKSTNKTLFHLSKEVYVNLFQEINKYEHSINQTYLIDTSSTSLLRRKHYFMVVLMSLKFKFHLFVVNLLNHRQLANWFDYLNKNKDLLKNFYDLKQLNTSSSSSLSLNNKNNSSGDSGVGAEFMNASILSSTSSLNHHNKSSESSSSLSSLANVSVFEHDEYFHYFLKLLEQFDFVSLSARHFIDMKITSQLTSKTAVKSPTFNNNNNSMLNTTEQSFKSQQSVAESQMNYLLENHLKSSNNGGGEWTTGSRAAMNGINATKSSHNISVNGSGSSSSTSSSSTNGTIINNNSPNGFNLKNISKKLNIKSWFSNNNGASQGKPPSSSSSATFIPQAATTSNIAGMIKMNGATPKMSRTANTMNTLAPPPSTTTTKTTGYVGRGIMVHDDDYKRQQDVMKHSASESNLNRALK